MYPPKGARKWSLAALTHVLLLVLGFFGAMDSSDLAAALSVVWGAFAVSNYGEHRAANKS